MSERGAAKIEQQFEKTWDGEPISPTPPFGAMIVVYDHSDTAVRYLLLHRAHHGPDFAGDWAWGPPSGARHPGEPIDRCAERELLEETGLRLRLDRADTGPSDWIVYRAMVDHQPGVRLSSEHDRHAWLPLDEAITRVMPAVVREQLLAAARLIEANSKVDNSAG